jgi:GntR family transcriptional regulator, rspAB operon transcriptional repressor
LLREQIYGAIRADILNCYLAPGTELREQALAEAYSVSKSPVRESLQRLVREGLVLVQPRKGYRVAPISLADATDLFSYRQVLELACVVRTCKSASDDQIKDLDRFRRYKGKGDADFLKYNHAFHSDLAACSGNRRMAREVSGLIAEMDRLVRLSVSVMKERNPQELVEEHAAIIEAVQHRDHRLALKLLKAHTSTAEQRLSTALGRAAVQQ